MLRKLTFLITALLISACLSAQQPDEHSYTNGLTGLWAGVTAGPSLLIEKAPDSLQAEFRDYLDKLRTGWHYGLQAEYFFNPYLGVGVKYIRFTTSQDADSIVTEIFSTKYYISISNNMHIHTLMPMVYGKLPMLSNKVSLVGGIGPAWLIYRNIYKSIDDSANFKGSSPGLSVSLRFTYQVIPNLQIGLQGNYLRALLKGYTKDDGTTQEKETFDKEEYQNLSRLDFSFGVFYTLQGRKNRN
jgi:hypothetical protein